MNILKDVMSVLNRRKERTKSSTDVVSMNNGNHGKIFGINRKIVIGIGILFFTVFIIAFIFASDDSNKKKADKSFSKNDTPEIETTDTASQKTERMPGDYKTLHDLDSKAAGKDNNKIQPVRATRISSNGETSDSNQESSNSSSRSLPAVPVRGYGYSPPYSLPFSNGSTVQAQPASASSTSSNSSGVADNIKNGVKSAIAFALGGDTNATDSNSSGSSDEGVASAAPAMTYTAPSGNSLQIGTLIPVMLRTGINSDAQGPVEAQVESDIYDSLSGSTLLIPAGSKLFGKCDKSSTQNGRVSVTFDTLVMPDGSSWNIGDSMIAVDGNGYAGILGNVNNHTGKAISGGMLASGIAALGSIASGNTNSNSDNYTAGQLAGQGAMAGLVSSASKLFEKGLNVTSTVTVDPGYEFNIYVTKPIAF